MQQTWLRSNTRLTWALAAAALAACATSAAAAWYAWFAGFGLAARAALLIVAVLIAVLAIAAVGAAGRPRLAYVPGFMLVRLRNGPPIRLPIELVECFLIGRGPSRLPGKRHAESETTTLVVRLRPQAEEWSHVDVDHRLGSWCDSHIIIRGTWSEPIDVPLAQRLNDRLVAAQRGLTAGGAS